MRRLTIHKNWLLAIALIVIAAATVATAVLSTPPLSNTQVIYEDTGTAIGTTADGTIVSSKPVSPTFAAGRLNLNTASAEQLTTLRGIGTVLAERIVAYREQHGAFHSVDELGEVKGIGEGKLAALRNQVTVE